MSRLSAKAALLSIVFGPMLMRADVVFSNVTNLGAPLNSHAVCSVVSGCSNNALAAEFTPTGNFTMTGAQVLVVQNPNGNDQAFNVFLDSDNGGAPGSLIAQIGFDLTASATAYPGSLVTASSIGGPIPLVSGTHYWLVLTAAGPSSEIFWSGGGSPTTPGAVSVDGGSTWPFLNTSSSEFQIFGTPSRSPVPEPSSIAMLAGAVTLVYRMKQRRVRT